MIESHIGTFHDPLQIWILDIKGCYADRQTDIQDLRIKRYGSLLNDIADPFCNGIGPFFIYIHLHDNELITSESGYQVKSADFPMQDD